MYRPGRVSVAALLGAAAAASGADALIASYSDAIAVSADDGSGNFTYSVKDSGTPANDVSNGDPQDVFTNGTTSPKLCLQSDGTYQWSPHNYMERSDDFDDAEWSAGNSSVSATNLWTADSAAAGSLVYVFSTDILDFAVAADELNTYSLRVTPGTLDYVYLSWRTSSTRNVTAVFDLGSGIVGETRTEATTVSSSITDNGDGSYWCHMTWTDTSGTGDSTPQILIGMAPAATGNTFDDNGYIEWDSGTAGTETLQLHEVAVRKGNTDGFGYLATTTGAVFGVASDYDPDESEYTILCEATATNQRQYSHKYDGIWTNSNSTLSETSGGPFEWDYTTITGTFSASATTAPRIFKNETQIFGGTDSVISAVVKAGTHNYVALTSVNAGNSFAYTFDLSDGTTGEELLKGTGSTSAAGVISLGNGWYRCYVVGQTTAGTSNCRVQLAQTKTGNTTDVNSILNWTSIAGTETLHVAHFQWESGSYPTSPIPTYGASVTRDQDELEWASGTTFLDSAVTLIADMKQYGAQTAGDVYASINDNSTSDHVRFDAAATNGINGQITRNSSAQADIAAGASTITDDTRFIAGIAQAANDAVLYVNGTSEGTDASVTVTGAALTHLSLGCDYNAANNLDAATRFYNVYAVGERIGNSTIATLTTP